LVKPRFGNDFFPRYISDAKVILDHIFPRRADPLQAPETHHPET